MPANNLKHGMANMSTITEAARALGKRAASKQTKAERVAKARAGGAARWVNKTKAERSEYMTWVAAQRN